MKIERMSHSKASTAELCGQLFVFRYLEDHQLPFGAGGIRGKALAKSAEVGFKYQLAHEGARAEIDLVKDVAVETLSEEIHTLGVRHTSDYAEVPPERLKGLLVDEVAALAGLYHTHVAAKIVPVKVEHKVELSPSDRWPFTWVGIIDVLSDQKRIHDAKTMRKSPPKNKANESDQLTGYEILYQALYSEPSCGQVLDFVWRTPARGDLKFVSQETTRDAIDLRVFVDRMANLHRALEAEIYLPAKTTDWICSPRWCDFTELCPYFRGQKRAES